MDKKVRIGILGAARIATKRVIPAMQQAGNLSLYALASRSIDKAKSACAEFEIPNAYDSYDLLLADSAVDAVYIPLPNNLHVEWAIKALNAGKHVLCEKPIAINSKELEALISASTKHPELKLMEAFMYRLHPQWIKTKELIGEGQIGRLRTIHTHFSYFNDDPNNVRNIAGYGGGGLLDIGCYAVSSARYIFGKEPEKVTALLDKDPQFDTDRIASGMMDFGTGFASFHCSTQMYYHQQVEIIGTTGRIKLQWPFNPDEKKPAEVVLYNQDGEQKIQVELCNQFTLEAEAFANSILQNTEVPITLSESIANLKVIDAIGNASVKGEWETIN
ncbi:MAG: putative dehydrogenase [Limisphaerales bacterium]|jgi:predicted dehydrogenase